MAVNRKTIYIVIFIIYLAVLVYFTIFAESFGRVPGNADGNPANCNLIPFNEIRRFIVYRRQLGPGAVFLNIFGNIAAFIPAGILVPVISGGPLKPIRVVFAGFFISLMIETSQFIFKVGSFDVDDLILNTLGVLAGLLIYRVVNGS